MSSPSVIGLSTLGPPVHSRYSLQVVTSLPCMAEKDHAHLVTVLSHTWSLYCRTPGHCIVTHLVSLLLCMAETDHAHLSLYCHNLVTVLSHTWSLYCHTLGHCIVTHLVPLLLCMAETDHANLVTVLPHTWSLYCHTSGHCIVTHMVPLLSHTWSLYCHTPGHFIVKHLVISLSHTWSLYCHTPGHFIVTHLITLLSHTWSFYCHTTDHFIAGVSYSLYWPVSCSHNCCTGRYVVLTVAGVAGDVGHLVQSGSWWRGAGLHQTAGVGCGVGTRLEVQHCPVVRQHTLIAVVNTTINIIVNVHRFVHIWMVVFSVWVCASM